MKALLHLLTLAGPQRPALIATIGLRALESLVAALPLGVVLLTAAAVLDPEVAANWPLPSPLTLAGGAALTALLAAAYALQWGLFHLAARCGYVAGYRMTARLRRDVVEHLRILPAAFFHRRDSGNITQVMLGDIARIELFPGIVLPRLVVAALFPLIGVAAGLAADWRLGLPLAAAAVLLPAALVAGNRLQDGASRRASAAAAILNGRMLEFILGMPVLKAFRLSADRLRECDGAVAAARDSGKALAGRYVLAAMLVPAVMGVAATVTLIAAYWQMRDGSLSPWGFVLFVFLALRLFAPVIELVEFSAIVQQMAASAERLVDILDAPAQAAGGQGAPPAGGAVRFEDVGLVHEDGTTALSGVSFTAPSGGITALVGHTGAGKTTAARLIARFWDPSSGRVTLGGTDLRDVPPERLAELVGVVSQQVVLFSMSVRDNIRLARPEATDAEIEAAARRARCHDLIATLPQGYDTVLDNGGAALSGGERQRLALARLFLRDSPVVVLDEATSALDVENEHLVQQALHELVAGRTVVVIAHRLWTVRHADVIVVLEEGRVAEQGTHTALMAAGGPYRRLWQALEQAPGWGGS